MSAETQPPAKRPCGSCPYRQDVPSGVWAKEEYEKLPRYDGDTVSQPPSLFLCHQQDGRVCAGWAATHNMDNNLGLRIACFQGVSMETVEAIRDYETDVSLFASGQKAYEHGVAEIEFPSEKAAKAINKVVRKQGRGAVR